MKFLTIPFAFLLFFSSPSYAENNEALHIAVSAATGYAAETFIHNKVDTNAERIIYGTLLGTAPGLAKELIDDEFSERDMAANLVGAFIGSYIGTRLNRNLTVNVQKQNDGYMLGFVYKH